MSPGAVPAVDPELVLKALASFAPTSGAGPSGLRPSHLQEALRYSSGDQTLRLLSEVLQLMLRGEVSMTSALGFAGPRSWPSAIRSIPCVPSLSAKHFGGFAARCPSNSWAPRSSLFSSRFKGSGGAHYEIMDPNLPRRPRPECWCSLTSPNAFQLRLQGRRAFKQCAGTFRGWHLWSTRAIVSIPVTRHNLDRGSFCRQ